MAGGLRAVNTKSGGQPWHGQVVNYFDGQFGPLFRPFSDSIKFTVGAPGEATEAGVCLTRRKHFGE